MPRSIPNAKARAVTRIGFCWMASRTFVMESGSSGARIFIISSISSSEKPCLAAMVIALNWVSTALSNMF